MFLSSSYSVDFANGKMKLFTLFSLIFSMKLNEKKQFLMNWVREGVDFEAFFSDDPINRTLGFNKLLYRLILKTRLHFRFKEFYYLSEEVNP